MRGANLVYDVRCHLPMNLAVIEYSSKSGEVWRHQPQRPNYLEDTEKVIDATSFGGYVSAFGGEHIPLTGLALGKPPFDQQPAASRYFKKIIKKITGSWPRRYALDYLKKFDAIMAIHQLSDAHEIAALVTRVKRELPDIFIIGVPTQPFGLLKPHIKNNPHAKAAFIRYMDGCDLFVTVVRQTKDWYKSLTRTPVEYLPQIYPVEFACRYFRQRQDKDKAIFAAGVAERPDIAKGFKAAALLQQEFPGYQLRVTRMPGEKTDLSPLSGVHYKAVPFCPWRDHLPHLSKYMLVINTDYTFTRGRVQMDSAAVGTPSLGANSDGQIALFSELASDPDSTAEEIAEKGRRLLRDEDYYEKVITDARQRLPKYNYQQSAARLRALINKYSAKKL